MEEARGTIDKRDRVLKTALRLFTSQGFHATPTSQIAREAGVATGTLFHYFKSKDELINALYLESRQAFVTSLVRGIKPEMSLKDRGRLYFMNSLHWGVEHRDMFLFYQQFANSPYIDARTRKRGVQEIGFLMEYIGDGQREGVFREMPADMALAVIESIKIGMIQYFMEHRERLNNRRYTEAAFSAIWNSITR
ncbi:MAG: TetR/AcrR family transcriptional regulator [Spirochaetes bacterium]|nr:TetR/AcrR family transcriptional regulator [Spirochaetota bacterium]